MAEEFGVIVGIISLVGLPFFATGTAFGLDSYRNGPPLTRGDYTIARLYTGSETGADENKSLGGHTPSAVIYNSAGEHLSHWRNSRWYTDSPKFTKEDGFVDIKMDHKKTDNVNRTPEYLALSVTEFAMDDAICIAGLQVTLPDQTIVNISGDMVVGCGKAAWYPSSHQLFANATRPPCFFLDSDNTSGGSHQGFRIHLPSITAYPARAKQYGEHLETWCGAQVRMSMMENFILDMPIPTFWPRLGFNADHTDPDFQAVTHPSTRLTERWGDWKSEKIKQLPGLLTRMLKSRKSDNANSVPKSRFPANRVIRTIFPEHSVEAVCNSPLSRGPSMTSLVHKQHCDMTTRTVYPFCAPGVEQECYNDETHEILEWVEDENGDHLHESETISATTAVSDKTTLSTVFVPPTATGLNMTTPTDEAVANVSESKTSGNTSSASGGIGKRATRKGYKAVPARVYTDIVEWDE